MTSPTPRRKRPGRNTISLVHDEDRYGSSTAPEEASTVEPETTGATEAPSSSTKRRSDSGSSKSAAKTTSGRAAPRKSSTTGSASSSRKSPTTKAAAEQATEPPKKKTPARSPSARGRGQAPPPEPPPADDSGALEGEELAGEPRDAITVKIPRSLKARIDGLVTHSALTGDPEEVESMTDFIRIATHRLVTYYEQTYNRGAAFPAPRRLIPGRRTGR